MALFDIFHSNNIYVEETNPEGSVPTEGPAHLIRRVPEATENCLPIPLVDPTTNKPLFHTHNPSVYAKRFYDATRGAHVKPKLSYCQLIVLALRNSPYGENEKDLFGLATLTDIYDYITNIFPYYRNVLTEKGLGWQNSIRYNLSLNKVFVKWRGARRGGYWTINKCYYNRVVFKTTKKFSILEWSKWSNGQIAWIVKSSKECATKNGLSTEIKIEEETVENSDPRYNSNGSKEDNSFDNVMQSEPEFQVKEEQEEKGSATNDPSLILGL